VSLYLAFALHVRIMARGNKTVVAAAVLEGG
jgi:hypothetical protein